MLGSNPSAEIDDRSMGQCNALPFFFLYSHALVHKALNPGGLGAGPHFK